MCRRTYNTGEFMRGIIAVLVVLLSIIIPLSAHGNVFLQEKPVSVNSSIQDVAVARARVHVFTEGVPADGAIPEDYQDRVDTVKDVLKAMTLHRLPMAPRWTDADVVLRITGREKTVGGTETREVRADVLFLGQTTSVIGRAEGGSWQAAADDLVSRLSEFVNSNESQILAGRGPDGRNDPTGARRSRPSLQISNPQDNRIPLFIGNIGSASGFTDPSKDRKDSAKDLWRALSTSSAVRLVDQEQDAVILVEVLGRETTREVNGWTALFGSAQNKSHLAVRLTVGEFSTEFSADGGSSGMLTAYAKAAGSIGDQIVKWVNDNRQRLTERLQQKIGK